MKIPPRTRAQTPPGEKRLNNAVIPFEKFKKKDAPIAVFDSGSGGVSVLRELTKMLPYEDFFYFGDSKNAPYGIKKTETIRALTLSAAARLLSFSKALVLACNTATAAGAAAVRAAHPGKIVIGMEPALLPALRAGAVIAVLATPSTLSGGKFEALCHRVPPGVTVYRLPAPELVPLVEAGLGNGPAAFAYLRALAGSLPERPDAVVLGCTHFPFATAAIRAAFGKETPLFDGAAGTARELTRRLSAAGLLRDGKRPGVLRLTASAPASVSLFSRLFLEN